MIFSIAITSCVSSKTGNFNKQKFTKLKQLTNSGSESTASELSLSFIEFEEDTTTESSNCDTLFQKTGEYIVCEILEETNTEILFKGCGDKDDSEYSILKSLLTADGRPADLSEISHQSVENEESSDNQNKTTADNSKTENKINIGNRNNFETLDTENQNKKRVRFRKNMNLSFFFLALGGLFALLGLFYVFFFAGLAFIAISWFMAIAACTTVKRVDITQQSRSFRIRYSWMAFIYAIGVMACTVTILGGIVLLLLWLARVI